MLNNIVALIKDDEGASLVEYALIVALVSVVAFISLQTLGTNANAKINQAATDMNQ